VIAYVQQRAGLLQALETATYAFPHRTFQEYLAARYLMRQAEFDQMLRERVHRDPTWWQEVFLLAAGSSRDTPRVISILVDSVLALYEDRETLTPERVVWARLAARALVETRFEEQVAAEEVPGRYTRTYQDVQQWLVAGMQADRTLNPRERVAAGDQLARLGDPRFRADAWSLPDEPLLGFVEIPAGPFVMGTREEEIPGLLERYGGEREWYERETPQHTVDLPGYYIARYPVTVAQFRAFVKDSKYEPGDPDSLRGMDNHPVVWVNWHDAQAYCEWLTGQLRAWEWTPDPLARLLRKDNGRIMLPSEAQWEKAARGPLEGSNPGRIFPWGNDPDPNRANYERAIGRTSTVGCFPGGAGPYDIEDLSGNVWEWTRTQWQENYAGYQPDLPVEDRAVVRGGAFSNYERLVRCASRYPNYPLNRSYLIGFRVVCGVPHPSER
jgi:formylglycine-generating enzyme required for sulfatase activity